MTEQELWDIARSEAREWLESFDILNLYEIYDGVLTEEQIEKVFEMIHTGKVFA